MLNFTVGPVQLDSLICDIGAQQVPYFRTPEFSKIMKENELLMKKFAGASEDCRTVFLTGSGTASMEAVVMNVYKKEDKVLVVNGGSFGQRFVDLCTMHEIPYTAIELSFGNYLTQEVLEQYRGKGYTSFLVNIHETSTGVLYDLQMISKFCKEENLLLVVDAISSFLADPIYMEAMGIDVLIVGSQKALACHPGISSIILSNRALERVEKNQEKSMYLSLKSALKNGERGQTPFTPAVGILLQIHARLCEIDKNGVEFEWERTKALANDFRKKIEGLPLEICSKSMSNAVTPVHPKYVSAYHIFTILKDEYGIWVCPNGGELANILFRVGHIGALSMRDNDILVDALHDMNKRGLLG